MKICPTCHMTVDETDACPFCHTTLTYEKPVPAEREHIIPNRYFWLYLLKNAWFSVLCASFCIVRVCMVQPKLYGRLYIMVLFALLSLFLGVFRRKAEQWGNRVYQASYLKTMTGIQTYLFGVIAVLFSFFI